MVHAEQDGVVLTSQLLARTASSKWAFEEKKEKA